jgi:hypothetical protein
MKNKNQKVCFVLRFSKNNKQFYYRFFYDILALKEHKEQLIKVGFKTNFLISEINKQNKQLIK